MSRASRLLDWYDQHARSLPWRAKPGVCADPYKVWLSEIMLQQTTVATVGKYFLTFTYRWPTVEALAAAHLDDVLREWAGLGYYARARNLHACAKAVVDDFDGRFPDTEAGLLALPGIGPYTAAAIAAIAFNQPAAAVDGNVERVISRMYAITDPLPGSKPQIRSHTNDLVPIDRPGDFAQALMDLGATLCTPRKPDCLICPWGDECKARSLGIAETLPLKVRARERPIRQAKVFWVERADGALLMRRRQEKGLLGGMLEFPSTGWDSKEAFQQMPPYNATWRETGKRIEHTFTHFHLLLDVLETNARFDDHPKSDSDWRWIARDQLAREALPTAMKKVVAAMLGPQALTRKR
ncbi:MAG: A/G-specific adenine glycosylase [Anderseniella sp.]